MPVFRKQLESMVEQDVKLTPGTHKVSVLDLLARNPDEGYEPHEIAEETSVPDGSIHKVLQRLREEELVETISGYYLVNASRVDEINQMLLTTRQLSAAETMSDTNTAPDEVEMVSPEDVAAPDDSVLPE